MTVAGISSHFHSTLRLCRRAVVAVALSASVATSAAFAQSSVRQPVDTGVRNTKPSRPMSTPRSAGGMAGMDGMAGMAGMSGMSGMKDTAGMAGMAGMKDMAGMSGMSDTSGMSGMMSMPGMRGSGVASTQDIMEFHMRMMAMMELHTRMMADPSIRQRVTSDAVLRTLSDRVSAPQPGGGGMSVMAGMSDSEPKPKRAAASRDAAKPAPRSAPKPSVPVKPSTKKKAPMPPMPGMDHSKMPGT